MALGGVEETVTVQAEAPLVDMRSAEISQYLLPFAGLNNSGAERATKSLGGSSSNGRRSRR